MTSFLTSIIMNKKDLFLVCLIILLIVTNVINLVINIINFNHTCYE
jgi:hypothetical protein